MVGMGSCLFADRTYGRSELMILKQTENVLFGTTPRFFRSCGTHWVNEPAETDQTCHICELAESVAFKIAESSLLRGLGAGRNLRSAHYSAELSLN
jgi:hypothetical protein